MLNSPQIQGVVMVKQTRTPASGGLMVPAVVPLNTMMLVGCFCCTAPLQTALSMPCPAELQGRSGPGRGPAEAGDPRASVGPPACGASLCP